MKTNRQIACVTGGSGIIGKRIVKRLKDAGFKVRVLSRKEQPEHNGVEFVKGELNDNLVLKDLLCGADMLFHCAGELHDESKMNLVNVKGTELLIETARTANIQYFCHLSSAGVIGKTSQKWVDERVDCQPQNAYERSKYMAERVAQKGIDGCRVIILRPTNVVDNDQPGVLKTITDGTTKSRLKLMLIGGECSHIIHADNVAAAAIHFIDKPFESPECFFVSADNESRTTFAELFVLYKQLLHCHSIKKYSKPAHLPIFIPYLLRKVLRGNGNIGDVRYSSERLFLTGLKFPLNIEDTLRQFLNSAASKPCAY